MAYVVAIELDNEQTTYKVFRESAGAIKLFKAARNSEYWGSSVTLREGGETTVLGCKMYKTATADVRESVRLVKEGNAERFYEPMSDRDKKLLDELMAAIDDKPTPT
jgi:hypothetical protein